MLQQRCRTAWCRPYSKSRAKCKTAPRLLTSISLIWMPDDLILIFTTNAYSGLARHVGSPPRGARGPVLVGYFPAFVSLLICYARSHWHPRVCARQQKITYFLSKARLYGVGFGKGVAWSGSERTLRGLITSWLSLLSMGCASSASATDPKTFQNTTRDNRRREKVTVGPSGNECFLLR